MRWKKFFTKLEAIRERGFNPSSQRVFMDICFELWMCLNGENERKYHDKAKYLYDSFFECKICGKRINEASHEECLKNIKNQ